MNSYNHNVIELERKRIKGVQKVLDGAKQTTVANELNVSEGTVSKWMKKYRENGWEGIYHKPKPGRPRTFTDLHSEFTCEIVSHSPKYWGFESDLWTAGMVRDILNEKTKSNISTSRVLVELHKLGFSFQKPKIKAIEKKRIK